MFNNSIIKKENTNICPKNQKSVYCMPINRHCSFPIHTLIADAIDTCGGSIRLKTLLKHLGVCASNETHARYLQYRVETKQKEGPLAGHDLNCPIIV